MFANTNETRAQTLQSLPGMFEVDFCDIDDKPVNNTCLAQDLSYQIAGAEQHSWPSCPQEDSWPGQKFDDSAA